MSEPARKLEGPRLKLVPTSPSLRRAVGAFAMPATDVFESDETILMIADVPGVTEADVSLHVEKDQLHLRARRSDTPKRASESPAGYQRSFPIPRGIDTEEVRAVLHNGELRVKIPKAPMPALPIEVIPSAPIDELL